MWKHEAFYSGTGQSIWRQRATVDFLKVKGFGKLTCPHGGSAEITNFAYFHEIVEGFQCFFPRSERVGAMNLVQVDIISAKAFQTMVDLGHN